MKKRIHVSKMKVWSLTVLSLAALFTSNYLYALDADITDTGDIKLGLAVDLNRDGFVDLEESQPGVDAEGALTGKKVNDKTTPRLPYRFWINNDLDVVSDQSGFNYDNAIDLNVTNCEGKNPSFNQNPDLGEIGYRQVCEQWDEDPIVEGMTNTSNSARLKRIEADGDLEDFSPLLINIELDRYPEKDYTIELKAVGVGINIFKGAWGTDNKRSHAYIYDDDETKEQIALANGSGGHVFTINKNNKVVLDNKFINKHLKPNGGDGYFIFEGVTASDSICQSNAENCYLSLAMYKKGDSKPISEERLYLDLHETKDFYEHITAGSAQGGDRTPSDFNAQFSSGTISQAQNRKVDIYAGLYSQEAIKENMILYVHGWRVLDIEKLSFGETTFKRLYWSGYYGQFVRLSWPTGWFDKPAGAYNDAILFVLGNERNYNISEAVARRVGEKLKNWLEVNYIQSKKHAVAHSMGNVVVSEALRTADDNTVLLTSYSPSQSAESAGAYDSNASDFTHLLFTNIGDFGCPDDAKIKPEAAWRCYNDDNDLFVNTQFDMPPDLWRSDYILRDQNSKPILDTTTDKGNIIFHGATSDDLMGANDLGNHYYKGLGAKVTNIINFYNQGDAALSAWEFNQLTKPDFLDGTTWHYSNAYLQAYEEFEAYEQCLIDSPDPDPVSDCISSNPDWPAIQPSRFEADGITLKKYTSEFKLGDQLKAFNLLDAEGKRIPNNLSDAIDILAHVIPARTAAVGQVEMGGEFGSPTNNNVPSDFTDSNHDHSAAYYGSYSEISPKGSLTGRVRANYWRNILNDSLKLVNEGDVSGLAE